VGDMQHGAKKFKSFCAEKLILSLQITQKRFFSLFMIQEHKSTRAELLGLFDELGIKHQTFEHRRVFTVDDGEDIKKNISGGHSKNLFLKDKNGAFFLICALGDTQIKLNQVHKSLGCARLSFGNEEFLWEKLGVRPGSVTLFALINNRPADLKLVLDKAIFEHEIINFHPLLNNATTSISTRDIAKWLKYWGGESVIADFTHEIPLIENFGLEQ
jgi:Ala-tRNA(Pro) deacylase